jgi:hypothetical protein
MPLQLRCASREHQCRRSASGKMGLGAAGKKLKGDPTPLASHFCNNIGPQQT